MSEWKPLNRCEPELGKAYDLTNDDPNKNEILNVQVEWVCNYISVTDKMVTFRKPSDTCLIGDPKHLVCYSSDGWWFKEHERGMLGACRQVGVDSTTDHSSHHGTEIIFDIFQKDQNSNGWKHNILIRGYVGCDAKAFAKSFKKCLKHYADLGAMYYTNIVNDILFNKVAELVWSIRNPYVEDNEGILHHKADKYFVVVIDDYDDEDTYEFKVLDFEGYRNWNATPTV